MPGSQEVLEGPGSQLCNSNMQDFSLLFVSCSLFGWVGLELGYVAQASLELIILLKLACNLQHPLPQRSRAGMTSLCYQIFFNTPVLL